MRSIPLAIIKTYRLIPAEKRSLWSFGTSNSHLALASPSWTSLLHYGTPHFSLGKIDPGWDSPQPPYPGGRVEKDKDGTWDQVTKFSTNTYDSGWPSGASTRSFLGVFKSFCFGWFKMTVLLPFVLMGAVDPGWSPGSYVGGNWETTPPQR
jgi:hypothetical protein